MKNNRDIKLKSYDDIFNIKGNYSENEVTLINVNMLVDFRDHPFKVIANKDMEDLFESILLNGILVPIFVRPLGDRYEIISGHRRKYCATKAGLKQVPCIVKDMDYDDAVFAMIDSNIQRKNILPSEKAFSYKMKLSAIKRQGSRTDLTSRQSVDKSADLVGKDYNDSGRNVQRYIRLAELTPYFLDAVDKKKLAFGAGVDLSYLSKKEQELIEEISKEYGKYPTAAQTKILREKAKEDELNSTQIKNIMFVENNEGQKFTSTQKQANFDMKKFKKYFPENYSAKEIEDEIIRMLENRRR